jgi:heme/copper-type cytochrome/quinol oxidase subunit 3
MFLHSSTIVHTSSSHTADRGQYLDSMMMMIFAESTLFEQIIIKYYTVRSVKPGQCSK